MPTHYLYSKLTVDEVEALKTRYDVVKFDQVAEAFRSCNLGLTPLEIRQPGSWSTRHVIYIVSVKETDEEFIFRANIGYGAPELVLEREKLMTDLARNAGVPVNEIMYVDISRQHVPFDFQIQRKVAGEDLEDNFTGSQEVYDSLSVQLGEITARLHKVQLKGFGRFDHRSTHTELIGDVESNSEYVLLDLDNELLKLVDSATISEKQAGKIKDYYNDRMELMTISRGVLVHYDIADHNIMFEDDNVTGLIDWEAAVCTDPVLDIASMPTWKTHHPRLEKFIEGYKKVSQLPDNFEEKYALYELRTLLWKTVFCIDAGILNEPRKKRFTDCLERLRI